MKIIVSGGGTGSHIYSALTFIDAIKKKRVVLLSPACASFDMYRDFEERGRDFKRIVHELK